MANKKLKICISFITIFLLSISLNAQKKDFIKDFSIRVSPGILSYYGDISGNSFNPISTIKESSKIGFSLSALKTFDPVFGVQVQYTYGNLYSSNDAENLYFSGSLSEFSVIGKLMPFGVFPDLKNRFNLQPYVTMGIGTFGYQASKKLIDTDVIARELKENGLVMPFGLGLSVPINKHLAIDIDHSYRYTNTDLLDAHISYSDNKTDWYSLTSIGLRFTLVPPEQTIKRTSRPIRHRPPRTETISPSKSKVKKADDNLLNIYVESLMDDVLTSGEVFAVNLRINKGAYTGPAKLVQRFPVNFTPLEASSTNGRFSFSNRNVLIEWDNMPADSMLIYTYYVRIEKNVVGSQTITGRFEYENDNKWKTVRFNNYIFVDKSPEQIIEEKTDKNLDLYKEETKKDLKKEREEEAKLKAQKAKTEASKNKINIDPLILKDPVDDIEFRIQCGAFKDSDQGGIKLVERYGISENVKEVYEKGWYKYTVGAFDSYVEAVNFKNSFIKRTKLYTAFIVAYKNGKRVSNINDAFK